jgi:hypothetical protein
MGDVISRQDALTEIRKDGKWLEEQGVTSMTTHERELRDTFILREMPSAQPEDWMERNKERILQAGMEGREIEFRIGGRLFAIREKAQ